MDAQTFLDNFGTIAEAPGGVDRIRELIVDLGVRGKLVPRVASEGSAQNLLEQIRAERSSKGLRGGTEAVEGSPHPIPGHWAWTTFGWVTDSRLGKMLDKAKNRGTMRRYLRNTNVQWFRFALDDVAEMRIEEREIDEYQLRPGDLLICEGGEPGRVAIVDESVQGLVFQKALHRSRPLGDASSAFLAYILWRDARNGRLQAAFTGATIKHLTGKSLGSYPVPLPPAAEQKRVVAKVDELMQLCDDLEARQQARHHVTTRLRASSLDALTNAETDDDLHTAWSRIHTNWEALTDHPDSIDALRQTILQLATTGRLSGTGRRAWFRCKFGDQITLQRGFDITKKEQREGPYPVVSSGGVSSFHDQPACTGPGVVIGRKGSVGRVHWVPGDYWPHDTTLWVKDFHGNNPEYVYLFLLAFPLLDYESSTANPSLNRNRLHPVEVGWPDPSEQRAVVSRTRKLLAVVDELAATQRERDSLGERLGKSAISGLATTSATPTQMRARSTPIEGSARCASSAT